MSSALAGPTLAQKKITVQILDEIADQIERFIKIQVLTSTLVGVVTGIALWLFGLEGVPYYGLLFWTWMWGVWGLLLAVPLMMVVKVAVTGLKISNQLGSS